VTSLNVEVAPKQLELIRDVVPMATVIALLINPANQLQAERTTKGVHAAAAKLGLRLRILRAATSATSIRCLRLWIGCKRARS
jgi:putative tryptophan/tyrosine transport system substrate-binding protein